MQPLGRPEQLLLMGLLLGLRGSQRRGVGLRRTGLAALAALDPGEDEAAARGPPAPPHPFAALHAEDEDVLELHPLDRVAGEPLHGVTHRRLAHAGRL
jgi:hypothetical protein